MYVNLKWSNTLNVSIKILADRTRHQKEPDQGPITNPVQGGTSHDDSVNKSSVEVQNGQQIDSQSPQSAQSGLNFSNTLTNAAASSSTNK